MFFRYVLLFLILLISNKLAEILSLFLSIFKEISVFSKYIIFIKLSLKCFKLKDAVPLGFIRDNRNTIFILL